MKRRQRTGGERTLAREERLRIERQDARRELHRHGGYALALVREVAGGLATPEATALARDRRRALRGVVSYCLGVELKPRRRVKVTSRGLALDTAEHQAASLAGATLRTLPLLCAADLIPVARRVVDAHAKDASATLRALRALCEAAGDAHVPPPETQPPLPSVAMERVTRDVPGPAELMAFDRENRAARGSSTEAHGNG